MEQKWNLKQVGADTGSAARSGHRSKVHTGYMTEPFFQRHTAVPTDPNLV